jgi:arginyl-tRNA synthetase
MNDYDKTTADPGKFTISKDIYSAIKTIFPDYISLFSIESIFALLEKPPETNLGDYAMPCFSLSKVLKKNPQQIATTIANALNKQNQSLWIKKALNVGAFLNIFSNKQTLAKHTIDASTNSQLFNLYCQQDSSKKDRVMIEFSQPNTHKLFHIGHARNVCLGDSMCHITRYLGHQVVAANYIGDEGSHVAKCLWKISKEEKTPDDNNVEFYGRKYTQASQEISKATDAEKIEIQKQLSEILRNLENKTGQIYDLWKTTRQDCIDYFNRIYKWLNVDFDHVFYESEVSQQSQSIVAEYIDKGIFKESEKAYGIDMNADDLGFFMVKKSDGTTLYITKDLALAKRKFADFAIDRSIYIVGNEQILHFKQLFKALELMGFEQAQKCYHLPYAHVVLSEGKMSSRLGNIITFQELIDKTLNDVHIKLKKYDTWSQKEVNSCAHLLAVGAIKFGMLASDPNKEIVYDPKGWISFEGFSGPYLMYSYARAKSILRKASFSAEKKENLNLELLDKEQEYELLRYIYEFNNVVLKSAKQYKPSIIAHYLCDLAKSFNKIYATLPILNANCEQLKQARLALIYSFSITLKTGLKLLGIVPPERM